MGLTVAAPDGAEFEFEEVKTKKGTESLGEVPILVWKSLDSAVEHYGEKSILDVLDGTSLRVAFQSIARRNKMANKSDDDIANAQIGYKPGKRVGGVSTPASRAASAARRATEKTGNSDVVTQLLEQIAAGKVSMDDLAALGVSVGAGV